MTMDETNMMHGMHYSGQDVAGYIATEKLDGVRAYWDGQTLWTRGGHAINIPLGWRETLPAGVPLDGELFAGYGQRQKAVNAARYGRFNDAVMFHVFDVPMATGNYYARLYYSGPYSQPYSMTRPKNKAWKYVAGKRIDGIDHAMELLEMVKAKGGEGLMLRHPELEYMPGRTYKMLKLK